MEKVKIYLFREATNQLMIVDGDNAKEGYEEIKKALIGEKHSKNIGLVGSDFRIDIMKPNSKIETYKSYIMGSLLMDDNNCYVFDYGKRWYESLDAQLKKILKDDPYYFMKEKKDRK